MILCACAPSGPQPTSPGLHQTDVWNATWWIWGLIFSAIAGWVLSFLWQENKRGCSLLAYLTIAMFILFSVIRFATTKITLQTVERHTDTLDAMEVHLKPVDTTTNPALESLSLDGYITFLTLDEVGYMIPHRSGQLTITKPPEWACEPPNISPDGITIDILCNIPGYAAPIRFAILTDLTIDQHDSQTMMAIEIDPTLPVLMENTED